MKCKIVLLDFVHLLNYKIINLQHFGSWVLLPSSGKKGVGVGGGEEDRKPVCPSLRLAQPGSATDRLSVLFPPFFTCRRKKNPASETS
jgi:hypothetical protein